MPILIDDKEIEREVARIHKNSIKPGIKVSKSSVARALIMRQVAAMKAANITTIHQEPEPCDDHADRTSP